ncbi:hypothetical protein ACIQ6V_33770, partial [Streptomyces sp. NPDC096198]|uniref:hypothetical protein n=1 Tax=Streptomyces sp. NPDC096198 TaxID=3366080 RepID=UPI0037F89752
ITTPTTRGPASSPHPLTSPLHPSEQDERGSVTYGGHKRVALRCAIALGEEADYPDAVNLGRFGPHLYQPQPTPDDYIREFHYQTLYPFSITYDTAKVHTKALANHLRLQKRDDQAAEVLAMDEKYFITDLTLRALQGYYKPVRDGGVIWMKYRLTGGNTMTAETMITKASADEYLEKNTYVQMIFRFTQTRRGFAPTRSKPGRVDLYLDGQGKPVLRNMPKADSPNPIYANMKATGSLALIHGSWD